MRPASPRSVLSASRRTDIPAFYLDWFMDRLEKGFFEIQNPFNKKKRRVDVDPQGFHTIVFWSKNFGPFLEKKAGDKLIRDGYHLYFNFTVNSENSILEPRVPALEKRISQIRMLSKTFGPENIAWRFDPICHYRSGKDGPLLSNLDQFADIAKAVADSGITKCVTSFFDPYAKITRRIERINRTKNLELEIADPPLQQKTALIRELVQNLSPLGIKLHLCCEKKVFDTLDPNSDIRPNACINGRLYQEITGDPVIIKKDSGQRAGKGCRCTQSVDIGSYDDHPCFHNCIFCYARPEMDIRN